MYVLIAKLCTQNKANCYGIGSFADAFALTMTPGIKSTFTYSVLIGSMACFLLIGIPRYAISIDQLFTNALKDETENQYQRFSA